MQVGVWLLQGDSRFVCARAVGAARTAALRQLEHNHLAIRGSRPSRLHRPAACTIRSSGPTARITTGKSKSTPASTTCVATSRHGCAIRQTPPDLRKHLSPMRRAQQRREVEDAWHHIRVSTGVQRVYRRQRVLCACSARPSPAPARRFRPPASRNRAASGLHGSPRA
jgi:hypothetical protein